MAIIGSTQFLHPLCYSGHLWCIVWSMPYAIFGAGDIGCTVGVTLAACGESVTLIGRDSPTGKALRNAVTAGAVVLHTQSRWERRLSAAQCAGIFATDATQLANAEVIFVATKRLQNEAAAHAVGQHAQRGAIVVILQNGVGVADELRALLPAGRSDLQLVECVVSVNAVRDLSGSGARFLWVSPRDQSNPAFVLSGKGAKVAEAMNRAGLIAVSTDELADLAHAKLMLNCGMNAVNALSGIGLRQCIRDAGYR